MQYKISDLSMLPLDFSGISLVFLNGDLWAWKTTLSQFILKKHFGITDQITSPTYTYYNKYKENIYHFDLYRINNYDEFFAIGGEEILDSGAICFIEWPDVLRDYYVPDMEITLEKTDNEDMREINITYKK